MEQTKPKPGATLEAATVPTPLADRWALMLALLVGEPVAPPAPAQPGPVQHHRAGDRAPAAWAAIDAHAAALNQSTDIKRQSAQR